MAKQETHLSLSIVFAVAYAVFGGLILRIHPEFVLLAAMIFVIAGMLPNIDADPGGGNAREMGGLLTTVLPLVLIAVFPEIKAGGMPRLALVVICCYLLSRLVFVRFFERWTSHRGMIHSIPAAVITFEVVFLLFWQLYFRERFYLSSAAFLGFSAHLLTDAYGNSVEMIANKKRKTPVLKVLAPNLSANLLVYGCLVCLGWLVLKDVYPHLRLQAALQY